MTTHRALNHRALNHRALNHRALNHRALNHRALSRRAAGLAIATLLAASACSSADDLTGTTIPVETTIGVGSSTTTDTSDTTTEPTASTESGDASGTTETTESAESTTTVEETTTTTVPELIEPEDLPLPTDADLMASSLAQAEQAVRSAEVDDAEAASWGRRQQALYRELEANPEWSTAVLEGMPPELLRAFNNNWSARQNLSALVNSTNLATSVPAWRLRAPLPADELLGYYKEAEAQTGVGWEYLAAINLVETRMGRIEGLSTAGAVGPMQFLPSTWAECCEGDAANDRDAIIGAGVYLRARGFADSVEDAIFGYNNSQRYVDAVKAYAEVMRDNEAAYRGYHAWQVYFRSAAGLLLLPVGYEEPEPIPVDEWLAANPDALISPP